MLKSFIIFLTLLGLELICVELNQALSAYHIYVFTGGLLVSSVIFNLTFRQGLIAVFAAGLSYDAHASVYFGTHALLFTAVYVLLIQLQDRLPYDYTVGRVIIALICNLILFIALTFIRIDLVPEPSSMWPRVGMDILISQLFISLIALWFFALQKRSLILTSKKVDRIYFN